MLIKRLLQLSAAALGLLPVAALCIGWMYLIHRSDQQHSHSITRIDNSNHLICRLSVDDEFTYSVTTDTPAYNRRNLMLLYPGKRVWVIKATTGLFWRILGHPARSGWDISPIQQGDEPLIDDSTFKLLVSEGFTDSDISYSFRIPEGFSNPNAEKSTYGDTVSYGSPSVWAGSRVAR
jgi:hypothetical protein